MITDGVVSYVWALVQKKLDWSKVNGLDAILPAQQQPELMNSNKPFMVFSSSAEYNNGELEPMDSEIISFVIFGSTVSDVNRAVDLMRNAFKATASAENINGWMRSPSNMPLAPAMGDLLVTYTQVMDAEAANPAATEGSKYDGFVSVRVGYKTTPEDYSI